MIEKQTDEVPEAAHLVDVLGHSETGTSRAKTVNLAAQLLHEVPIAQAMAEVREIATAGLAHVAGGPVAAVSTAPVGTSGEQVIDGVLTEGDRVLLTAQADPAENTIWVTGAGDWTRAEDADEAGELLRAAVSVLRGDTGAGQVWVQKADSSASPSWALWQDTGPLYQQLSARIAALETIKIASLSIDGGNVFEVGTTPAPLIRWTLDSPVEPSAQTINGAAVAVADREFQSDQIAAQTGYQLAVTDGSGRIVLDTVTAQFRKRVYWGTSDDAALDAAGVLALTGGGSALATGRGRTFTARPTGTQYVYFAYPETFGAPAGVTAAGFATSVVETVVSVTTAVGHTENYRVVRLGQRQSNPIDVRIT